MGAYWGKTHILHAQFLYLFPTDCARNTHPDQCGHAYNYKAAPTAGLSSTTCVFITKCCSSSTSISRYELTKPSTNILYPGIIPSNPRASKETESGKKLKISACPQKPVCILGAGGIEWLEIGDLCTHPQEMALQHLDCKMQCILRGQ